MLYGIFSYLWFPFPICMNQHVGKTIRPCYCQRVLLYNLFFQELVKICEAILAPIIVLGVSLNNTYYSLKTCWPDAD